MFEFDAGKLVIIGIVALIVIGPKELPRVLRQVGQALAKLRHMAAEFRSQFMDAMREAELADIKDEAEKLAASARIDMGLDPIAELKGELTRAIDGPGRAGAASPAGEGALPPPAQDSGNSILAPDGLEAAGLEAAGVARTGRADQPTSEAVAEQANPGTAATHRGPDPLHAEAQPVSRT